MPGVRGERSRALLRQCVRQAGRGEGAASARQIPLRVCAPWLRWGGGPRSARASRGAAARCALSVCVGACVWRALCCGFACTRAHTHTHAHAHTNTHARTHKHALTHTQTRTHSHTHTRQMSGSEELAQAEEEQGEGGEEFEGNEDDQELAAMQKELEKAEQQKAELDKLNKMQGTASADSKQSGWPASPRAAAGDPPLPFPARARQPPQPLRARAAGRPRGWPRRDHCGSPPPTDLA